MFDDLIRGRIRISPALNAAERAFLDDVCDGGGTLRGTPTGRGDAAVPFAHLAWRACERGCCLTWDGRETSRHLTATLEFVIEHLLKPGARAAGHRQFPDFTCDHELDGVVVVQRYDDPRPRVVQVQANAVVELQVEAACDRRTPRPLRTSDWPANVVALRPRRA